MDIRNLYNTVAGWLDNETRQNQHVDTDGLLGRLGGIFRDNGYDGPDYSTQQGTYNGQEVLPASQDPLGDPADQPGYSQQAGYNQNPTGYSQQQSDANQGILPASQDPLGDPADQQQQRRW